MEGKENVSPTHYRVRVSWYGRTVHRKYILRDILYQILTQSRDILQILLCERLATMELHPLF